MSQNIEQNIDLLATLKLKPWHNTLTNIYTVIIFVSSHHLLFFYCTMLKINYVKIGTVLSLQGLNYPDQHINFNIYQNIIISAWFKQYFIGQFPGSK